MLLKKQTNLFVQNFSPSGKNRLAKGEKSYFKISFQLVIMFVLQK